MLYRTYMETQGNAGKQCKEAHFEDTIKEHDDRDLPILRKEPQNDKGTSSSSSSSSDDSSDEDLFQLDPSELNGGFAANDDFLSVQYGGNTQLVSGFAIQTGEAAVISPSRKHGAVNLGENEGMLGGSEVPTGRPASDINIFHAWQYPPPQSMTRTGVPDPNRIPSSIFARTKSSAPMEWSVASNESLFSIHVGNSSFSRDHVVLLGRSGELSSTPAIPKLVSGELSSTRPKYSIANSYTPANMDMEQGLTQPSAAAAAANAEAMKDVLRAAAEVHADKREPPADETGLCASISHKSDASTTSFQSFAFPILTGEGRRSASVKVEPERQQKRAEQSYQPPLETPKTTPAATENKWFSCFSCCTFCR